MNLEEAIAVANNSIYGLQGSVWTDNYRRAMRYAREIECGTFLVNSFGLSPNSGHSEAHAGLPRLTHLRHSQ